MNILSIKDVTKQGRDKPLFSGVTFGLNSGDKAALIGRNGCGKSTLLSCIAGLLPADDGTIVTAKQCGISYLPQNPIFQPEDTIRSYIFDDGNSKLALIRTYEDLCSRTAACTGEIPVALQQEYDTVTEEMNRRDLWNYESRIRQILTTLGITDFNRPMKTLSGGMIKKTALAQVLVDDTGLLLLDEPTNQLDIQSIAWLEDYLRNTDRAVLMVTHDRYFLDNVCSSIYELERGRLQLYSGNYSTYLEKKETEALIQENTERRIESVLRTEREWLMRGPQARGTKARARVDAIHRMINREKIVKDKGFSFEVTGRRLGSTILELDNISKSWTSPDGQIHPVITEFSYIFRNGERLGIFGCNGAGKTTLLNILTGTLLPDSGTVIQGKNTVFGYYRQNPEQLLATEQTAVPTVLEYIQAAAEVITLNNGKTLSAARMLEQFGFEGKIQYSPVTALSGGELKRLYLVRLLMGNPNFLVLDEPTNDLDIFTLSILESFLKTYAGCLIVVSHDRCFMDKTVDSLLILDGHGEVTGFAGSCSEYLRLLQEKTATSPAPGSPPEKNTAEKQPANRHCRAEITNNATEKTSPPGVTGTAGHTDTVEVRRRTYREQQEFQQLEQDIFAAESRKEELEQLLSGGETDYSRMKNLTAEYGELSARLEQAYLRWEELGVLKEY